MTINSCFIGVLTVSEVVTVCGLLLVLLLFEEWTKLKTYLKNEIFEQSRSHTEKVMTQRRKEFGTEIVASNTYGRSRHFLSTEAKWIQFVNTDFQYECIWWLWMYNKIHTYFKLKKKLAPIKKINHRQCGFKEVFFVSFPLFKPWNMISMMWIWYDQDKKTDEYDKHITGRAFVFFHAAWNQCSCAVKKSSFS